MIQKLDKITFWLPNSNIGSFETLEALKVIKVIKNYFHLIIKPYYFKFYSFEHYVRILCSRAHTQFETNPKSISKSTLCTDCVSMS